MYKKEGKVVVEKKGGITIGFTGLLTLLLVAAKIWAPVASEWSWWMVFMPIWIGPALVVAFFLLALVISFIIALIEMGSNR